MEKKIRPDRRSEMNAEEDVIKDSEKFRSTRLEFVLSQNIPDKSFHVLAFDLESGNWSKVKDFGRKTLFVGFSSSFWIEDTSGVIKGNCIYYTDDERQEYKYSKKGGGRDMGIYHLSDGTIEHHFTGESYSHCTPPIWLQSM
ncbi:zinc finger, CCHC-type containing protein [Tanacetum coccineum]|uniref:Zinc finger, CCHC-type containing protein n=1 Tax=Tanacetum coccineum TaxID=301880 RepID=A0ABQ5A4Q5_9ASTR